MPIIFRSLGWRFSASDEEELFSVSPKAFRVTIKTKVKKMIYGFPWWSWLRLCTPNAGGLGSIPGQGTRSHMPQLKPIEAK